MCDCKLHHTPPLLVAPIDFVLFVVSFDRLDPVSVLDLPSSSPPFYFAHLVDFLLFQPPGLPYTPFTTFP